MASEEGVENPIIYLQPTSTMVSEPTLSLPDEEADIVMSSRPATTTSWLKRNYLPVTLAFLVLSGVTIAAVVFSGGKSNTELEVNMAKQRGIDTESNLNPQEKPRPPPKGEANKPPKPLKGENNKPPKPLKGEPKEEQIPIPESYIPTPMPSTLKPTFPTELDFSGLFIPTPPPTYVPTIAVSGQVSETVSTEVTGPPTLPDREG